LFGDITQAAQTSALYVGGSPPPWPWCEGYTAGGADPAPAGSATYRPRWSLSMGNTDKLVHA
jgi:hypothetical protein